MVKGTAGTLGFEEGMYGILYQVVQKTDELAFRGVPIYCVYSTESSTVKPSQLRNDVAIFPTREGVLSLLTFLNLKALIKRFYPKNYDKDEPFLPIELVRALFLSPAFLNIIDKQNCFKETTNENTKQRSKFSVKQYIQQRHDFHSKVKIRIAMIGGLHRTGTSCFFFSGEEATPNKELKIKTKNKSNSHRLIDLSTDMIINTAPPLTILLPKDLTYTNKYIEQCNAYSYHIEEWKHKSITPTYKSLSLMILDDTKHEDIEDEMRYKKNTIFTNPPDQVSNC